MMERDTVSALIRLLHLPESYLRVDCYTESDILSMFMLKEVCCEKGDGGLGFDSCIRCSYAR